jgi:triacylglycerol esterase/lipase EstA (alpha/beta hydrolase family)
MIEHIIVFSHGFGVRADDRGLFADIASALPEARTVTFDYNQFDEASDTLTVAPLDDQTKQLQQILSDVKAEHPKATIDLIAHSQGCVTVGLAKSTGIRRAIFIAPPATLNRDRMVAVFGARPGTSFNFEGTSRLTRADGSTTLVPPQYWPSITGLDPLDLYQKFARHTQLTFIIADQDEIIGTNDYSRLQDKVKFKHIEADHNFTGSARNKLTSVIRSALLDSQPSN